MIHNLFLVRRISGLFRWMWRHKLLTFVIILFTLYLSGEVSAYDAIDFNSDDTAAPAVSQALSDVAASYIGSDYERFCSAYGSDHVAWCALFVSYCAEEAGYAVSASSSCDDLYNNNSGTVGIAGLCVDDLLFFDWDDDGSLDHVGVVTALEGDLITTVEGNVDDTVKYCEYSRDDPSLYGYVRLNGGVMTYAARSVSFGSYDNVGTSNVSMFQGLASKISPVDRYVYARTGNYTYVFAWGDLQLEGTTFTGSADYAVYERTGTNNSSYTYTVYHDDSFVLRAGDYVVYSDLGNYPGIGGNENARFYVPAVMLLFLFVSVCFFVVPTCWSRSR